MSYLDMTGVDRVVAIRGPYSSMFATHAGNNWAIIDQTELMDVYERTTPQRRIGNIVQWPDGADIQKPNMTARSESYDIKMGDSEGRLIVARAWYPGLTAGLFTALAGFLILLGFAIVRPFELKTHAVQSQFKFD